VSSLDLADLDPDPLGQFRSWLEAAVAADLGEPSAMTLATADAEGVPSARTVLLKDLDDAGFVFFTHLGSRKGRELEVRPQAALVFHWQALHRQVCVSGTVAPLDNASSDAYFATRPRPSQLGAWASPQSQPLADRAELERRLAHFTARYAGGPVPRPPYWGGFRVTPHRMEFWQGRPDRLHDRFRYLRRDGGWRIERLGP
jgi:pyridoxamine 5'-phosphate oxidase